MRAVIEQTGWLSELEAAEVLRLAQAWELVENVAATGKFAGTLMSRHSWSTYTESPGLADVVRNKVRDLIGDHDESVTVFNYMELHYPWDVHIDYTLHNVPRPENFPYYCLLIPLEDYDSRTIFFGELAKYNEFSTFKQTNEPVSNPVDIEFWENNLSHCWPQDREFLSLRYVSKSFKAGNVVAFRRDMPHSSDNFHLSGAGPKRFLQIYTSTKKDHLV